ncbi:MAG: PDZ domain-containing protein [Planctomycetes bacterium]|nr:PDZ domain-containing protein [Planctomycetota bacterium]
MFLASLLPSCALGGHVTTYRCWLVPFHVEASREGPGGVRVGYVEPDQERALAHQGLRRGDLIVAVAGRPVRTRREFFQALRAEDPARPIPIRVASDGSTREVLLGRHPEDRTVRLMPGFWFLMPWLSLLPGTDMLRGRPPDLVGLFPLTYVGIGPDFRGFQLFGLLGYLDAPEGRAALLGPLMIWNGPNGRIERGHAGGGAETRQLSPDFVWLGREVLVNDHSNCPGCRKSEG